MKILRERRNLQNRDINTKLRHVLGERLSDVEDKSKEVVNPVYADAVRNIKKNDKAREEANKLPKAEEHKEKPKKVKMVPGAKKLYLDESFNTDEFYEIDLDIPSDPIIDNLYYGSDDTDTYNFLDLVNEIYPTAEFIVFDWKDSTAAKKAYDDAISKGLKVFNNPACDGQDCYGFIFIDPKEYDEANA